MRQSSPVVADGQLLAIGREKGFGSPFGVLRDDLAHGKDEVTWNFHDRLSGRLGVWDLDDPQIAAGIGSAQSRCGLRLRRADPPPGSLSTFSTSDSMTLWP